MISSFSQDVTGYVLVFLFVVCVMIVKGDGLYIGLWYYFAVAGVAFVVSILFRPRPGFLLGVAIALALTLFMYLQHNWHASRPDGLLGIGHLFSLPGALIGLMTAGWVVRRRSGSSSIAALLIAMFGVAAGFMVNQWLMCRTLLYCGKLLSGS